MNWLPLALSLLLLVGLLAYFAGLIILSIVKGPFLRWLAKDPAARMPRTQSLPKRFASLDGWRAVSILLVLGQHSTSTYDFPEKARPWFDWLFDGNLGVRFFFVISGFLITYLLLKEKAETGAISLRSFYSRRALRILPAYAALLAVVLALQEMTPARQPPLAWVGYLTFTSNFLPRTWPTMHLWSIAIEEQFYFLWPGLLCWAGTQNMRRLLVILAIPFGVAVIFKLSSYQGLMPQCLAPFYFVSSSMYYFDSLATGCAAAILLVKYNSEMVSVLRRLGAANAVLGAVLILVPYVLNKWCAPLFLVRAAANPLEAIGFAMLLLQSALRPRGFGALNWPAVRAIGVLSYSIYMWQQLFYIDPATYGLSRPWFMSFSTWLPVVFVVALISYCCLEKPLMGLRARFRPGLPVPGS